MINGALKTASACKYLSGDDLTTYEETMIDIEMSCNDISMLINAIKNQFNISDELSTTLNARNNIGLIEIELLENQDGSPATEKDIENWKNKGTTLYNCVYGMTVFEVCYNRVDLKPLGR
jgi:hypothetical protein